MNDEQKKKGHQKNFAYKGDDIQKWVNLSTFWKILALGSGKINEGAKPFKRTHLRTKRDIALDGL